MQSYRVATAGLAVVLAFTSWVLVGSAGQQAPAGQNQPPSSAVPAIQAPRMPLAPSAVAGASITPSLDGWFKNADGTYTALLGYSNRNRTQQMDIPVGPNNKIEAPAGLVIAGASGMDYGQPTHFGTGRAYAVFTITMPANIGTRRMTYTITANGQPQSITVGIPGGYQVEPFFRNDNGNTPPIVKADPTGPELKGPVRGIAQTLNTTVGQPVTLTLYAIDTGNTVDQQNQFGPRPPQRGQGSGFGGGGGGGGGGRGAGAGAAAPTDGAAANGAAPAPGAGSPGAAAGGGGRGGGRGGAGRGGAAAAGADPAAQAAAGGAAAAGRGGAGGGAGAGGGRGAGGGGGGGGGGRGASGPISLEWSKMRGPVTGVVTFEDSTPTFVADPEVMKMFQKPGDVSGKFTTTATFNEAGEWILRGQVLDASGTGAFGDQCCWSNVHYKVNVKAK